MWKCVRDEKTIELTWNAQPFHSTEKVGLYTNNTQKVTVSKSWTTITLEKEMEVFYHNTKVINGAFISCVTGWTQTKLKKSKNIDKSDCSISINLIYFLPNLLFWLGVHFWNECKQTWKLASLEPANFELSEIYHRDVQSLNRLAQLNFNT